ncbi:unannotated protein [freshwater metagenome]|uniref:Unannotated protein n=1 Tax=freshwater metagenome TaxID=449393 RepID=A0A6J7VKG9_9ZZZZ
MVDAVHGEAALGAGFGGAALIFANAEAGKVGGKHDANGVGDSRIGQRCDTIFDKGIGMFLSKDNSPCIRHTCFEC